MEFKGWKFQSFQLKAHLREFHRKYIHVKCYIPQCNSLFISIFEQWHNKNNGFSIQQNNNNFAANRTGFMQ